MRLATVYDDAISKFSLTSAVQFCTVTIPNYKEEVNMPVRYTCSLSRTICEIAYSAYYIISDNHHTFRMRGYHACDASMDACISSVTEKTTSVWFSLEISSSPNCNMFFSMFQHY